MRMPENDDTQPIPWLGRASARPRDLADTAEQPIVPSQTVPPPVVYVQPGRRLPIVGLMILCFAAGATIALLASPGLRDAFGLSPSPPGSSSPSPTEPPPPGIGDRVRDTAIEFRVTEVTCGHSTVGEGLLTRRAEGQYCVASFELRNVGSTLAILTVSDQFAVTADGSRQRGNPDATAAANGVIFVLPLPMAPGDSEVGKIVFDIPQDAALATLELHDNEHSDGAVITVPASA
jgi:Domain of unknown function (DUF4352)